MMRQDPGWRLWAALLETTRREINAPRWAAVAPRISSDRPDGAPLLAGATVTLAPRPAGAWVRHLFGRAAPALRPRQTRHAGRESRHFEPLAFLEAAVCSDEARLEGLASGLGMAPLALTSLASLATLPLLQACARALERQLPRAWPLKYCPVCGGRPTLAERRGIERVYRLRCARCGGDWGAPILCCPCCGEGDHRRLGTLVPDDSGETRLVTVCMTCKGYLKVLTTLQKTPGDRLVCDDLETVDLDIAALERGYLRPRQPGYACTVRIVPQPGRLRALFGGRAAGQRSGNGHDNSAPR